MNKTCPICGRVFSRLRKDKQTCSKTCKKALQRGGWRKKKPGSSAWSRAAVKGDKHRHFKHGQLVEFCHGPNTPWKPGRINWLSYVGEQIRLAVLPAGSLPVEDLTGVRANHPDFVRIP